MSVIERAHSSDGITHAVCLVAFTLLIALFALSLHWAALEKIGNFHSGIQERYIQDGYYYIYLGNRIIYRTWEQGHSWVDSAYYFSPNWNTTGMVYLASIFNSAFPFKEWFPLLFLAIYALIFYVCRLIYNKINTAIFLLCSGLFPYLFIPTKETILLIGLFFILFAVKKPSLRFLAIPGLALMFMGRPEAMFLLILSCFIYYLICNRRAGFVAMILFLISYVIFIRDLAYATSFFMQLQADQFGLSFDSIAGLPVSVTKSSTLELVYVTRLVVLTSVVVKWPMDLLDYLLNSKSDVVILAFRLSLVVQLFWGGLLLAMERPRWSRMSGVMKVSTIYALVYAGIYGAVYFYQPSRQLMFAMAVWLTMYALEPKVAETTQPIPKDTGLS